ncbi:Uma2 family endonuclease [Nitratifractor sp.]
MGAVEYCEHYTRKDYEQWEGDWELIYGDAYAMAPSPVFNHQFVSGKILRVLDEALDKCPDCHAVMEMDWDVSEETVVRPDSMVICYEPDERLTKRPEIIFEVISPGTARRDEILKFDLYRSEGVPFYLLVYPDQRKAKLYRLENHEYRKVGDFSDELHRFELGKCAIDFDFSKIWRQ